MLHVHRREHVDAGVEQGTHVFPSLQPRRSRHVRVRKLVDRRHLGMPAKNRVGVHLFETCSAVFDHLSRDGLQSLAQRDRLFAAVRLEIPDHDVDALVFQRVRLREHLIRFADTCGVA